MLLGMLGVLTWAYGGGLCLAQQGIPDKPEIRLVSVDTTDNSVQIFWNPSLAPDVKWYYIYKEVPTLSGWAGELIDSVSGSTYQYRHLLPELDRLEYSVTAMDSSGNESIRMPGSHTAVLTQMRYDSCKAELYLQWNQYKGWNGNLSGYRVFISSAGSPFQLHTLKFPGDTTLVLTDVQENEQYRYYIQAVKNDGLLSFSNISPYFTYMPPPPSYLNLDEVNVIDNSTVEITFSADLGSSISTFALYHSSSGISGFNLVEIAENVNDVPYRFTDKIATSGTSYSFRVDALNTCGKSVASTNQGNNILLSGNADGTRAVINWTPYKSYNGSLEGYQIYRLTKDGEEVNASFAGPAQTTYSEDLLQIGTQNLYGEVCYRVEAVESNDNPYGIAGRSKSNTACVDVPTLIHMPNAFTPNNDGKNDDFRPVMDFIPEDYLFIIFDRSGKKIFQTSDPSQGWTGHINGGPMAAEGVYTWFIQYNSYTGAGYVQSGSVVLILP